MPLGNIWRDFLVSADNTDVLSGDSMIGSLGRGWYSITTVAAAAADGTVTVNDGRQNIINAVSIPLRAAAVTYPELRKNEDQAWVFAYTGSDHPIINIADGTNAEVVVRVKFHGETAPRFA